MILYRYISIDEHFDNIITKREVYFNNPSKFNDPFDCNYILDTTSTVEEKTNFITMLIENIPVFVPGDINTLFTKIINNPDLFDRKVNISKDKSLARLGVLCFSKTNENPLLWAHYSDKHRGVCLIYDTQKDKILFDRTMEIMYRANYPKINFIKERARFDELVLTKSNDWIYEQEVRAIKTNFGIQNFHKDSLIGIIFGCKTDPNEIKRIKDLLTANNFNITTQKAMLRKASYGLDFVDI